MNGRDDPVVIEPRRGKREVSVTPVVLFALGPDCFTGVCRVARAGVRKRRRVAYSRLVEVEWEGSTVSIVGPAIGAPLAILVMEKLIVLGTRSIVALGTAGSLQQSLHIGDLLIVEGAVSEEGTSAHYPVGQPPRADPRILQTLETSCTKKRRDFVKGAVWTTDAPYREAHPKVRTYQAQGIWAVEMEMAALLTVGAFRGVSVGGLLVISDELYELAWKPGFRREEFLEGAERACAIALSACASL